MLDARNAARRGRVRTAAPESPVRAIVVLNIAPKRRGPSRRQNSHERAAAISAVKTAASRLVREIDRLLDEAGGRRTSENPDALGTISVETTPEGIRRLAASDHVRAVLEDQPLARLR